MNEIMQDFARATLKESLSHPAIIDRNRDLFKKMYAHTDLSRTRGECQKGTCKCLDRDINDVVDTMPEEKLDWAMQQVQQTIKKYIEEKV